MIVGLTGGIGSGKTTVAKVFESLGIAVYESDYYSKNLIDTDKSLQRELISLLGNEVVKNGRIDRPLMASLIFNNAELLSRVNSVIHPAVGEHFAAWVSKQDSPYVIKEAAILFESGSYKSCDQIVAVTADKELRIQRVMARNEISREEVVARMDKQISDEEKIEKSDFHIANNGNESLIKQVLAIHKELLAMA